MTAEAEPSVPAETSGSQSLTLVRRTVVPSSLPYMHYRRYLRKDFFYSCAYCTITEAEAQAIRFTIDHYEPVNARPDLENEYSNLMYACDECNQRKGDRTPPQSARESGIRFFRPDEDAYGDHFANNNSLVDPKTSVGDFTIDALDLNRATLRKLRELRARLTRCERYVVEGVFALRSFGIDQLPPHIRAQAAASIRKAVAMADTLADQIDTILADYARSALTDADPQSEPDPEELARLAERASRLKQLQALHPGSWRAPRKTRRKVADKQAAKKK